jgi:phosphoserine phosphatase
MAGTLIELKYTGIAATRSYINFLRTKSMNLVIQSGLPVATTHLDHLTRLAQSADRKQIAENAWRLTAAQAHNEIAPYCMANRLDYGFVPRDRSWKDIGLVVMDMDSTLIAIECIDEIADMHGLKPQVAAITGASMRGEIEFAEGLRRRVALLGGLDEHALQRVYDERLKLSPGAETMLAVLKSRGIRTLLVSGGFVFFTERLKEKLGLDYTQANTLEIAGGKLTGKVVGDIVDAQSKADWLVKVRDQLNLKPGQVIAMGDGANDLKMMAQAGISIAYHAKPVVREQASYALNFTGLDGLLNLLED